MALKLSDQSWRADSKMCVVSVLRSVSTDWSDVKASRASLCSLCVLSLISCFICLITYRWLCLSLFLLIFNLGFFLHLTFSKTLQTPFVRLAVVAMQCSLNCTVMCCIWVWESILFSLWQFESKCRMTASSFSGLCLLWMLCYWLRHLLLVTQLLGENSITLMLFLHAHFFHYTLFLWRNNYWEIPTYHTACSSSRNIKEKMMWFHRFLLWGLMQRPLEILKPCK